jgi:serine protease Do
MKNITRFLCISFAIINFSCKKDLKDIIDLAEKASFIIYTYDEFGYPSGSGSGFFIAESGVGITNYHVLDGSTKAIIITSDSSTYEIDKVISADIKKDILKFQIKNKRNKSFPKLDFSDVSPQKGDKVYCLGNPLGLENTLTDGLVSAIRSNSLDFKTIQFTAPISPGSSGGAVLDVNGNVIAIATSQKRNGQNLNFGTFINEDVINSINKDEFSRNNPKFTKRDRFIILNLKSDNDPFTVLNAIEFDENSTTAYMSFTNTHVPSEPGTSWALYQDLKKQSDRPYIKDIKNNFDYYLASSSLGDMQNPTNVALATTIRYKQFFPRISNIPKRISIMEVDSRSPKWSNINLEEYKNVDKFNLENYQSAFALSTLKEGELSNAQSLFLEMLEKNPENIEALSILGVISYALDNKKDAIDFFSRAIESNPITPVCYVNRCIILKSQGNIQASINDISKAISLSPDQPDFYHLREDLFLLQGDFEKAKEDFFAADEIYSKQLNQKSWRSLGDDEDKIYRYVLSLRKEHLSL